MMGFISRGLVLSMCLYVAWNGHTHWMVLMLLALIFLGSEIESVLRQRLERRVDKLERAIAKSWNMEDRP